jgi:hemerythrin-like metal-binding protein
MAELVAEIELHFKDEEKLLFSARYPAAAEHRKIHAELVLKAKHLMDRLAGDELSVGDLFNFMADDMISRHMQIEDRKFYPYFRQEA